MMIIITNILIMVITTIIILMMITMIVLLIIMIILLLIIIIVVMILIIIFMIVLIINEGAAQSVSTPLFSSVRPLLWFCCLFRFSFGFGSPQTNHNDKHTIYTHAI